MAVDGEERAAVPGQPMPEGDRPPEEIIDNGNHVPIIHGRDSCFLPEADPPSVIEQAEVEPLMRERALSSVAPSLLSGIEQHAWQEHPGPKAVPIETVLSQHEIGEPAHGYGIRAAASGDSDFLVVHDFPSIVYHWTTTYFLREQEFVAGTNLFIYAECNRRYYTKIGVACFTSVGYYSSATLMQNLLGR